MSKEYLFKLPNDASKEMEDKVTISYAETAVKVPKTMAVSNSVPIQEACTSAPTPDVLHQVRNACSLRFYCIQRPTRD